MEKSVFKEEKQQFKEDSIEQGCVDFEEWISFESDFEQMSFKSVNINDNSF